MDQRTAHVATHVGYRRDIDGLRAVAIIAVLFFHAFPEIVPGGFVGVDVFFVISGYLITGIIYRDIELTTFSFLAFYSRRIRRIFPALILVLLCCLAGGWLLLLPDEYQQLGRHVASGAGFVSNFVLWSETGYFDNAADTKPLLHLWSLAVEEQFYIIWPVLLVLARAWRVRPLVIVAILIAISFAICVVEASSDRTAAFYSPLTRLWQLAIGGFIALYQPKLDAISFSPRADWLMRPIGSALGLALIGFAVISFNKIEPYPGARAAIPTVGAALIIASGARAALNSRLFSARPLVWLGLISYPLYLWHWPLLSFARVVNLGDAPTSIRATLVLISVGLAWLTLLLLERPVRRGGMATGKAIVLATSMILTGALGYAIFTANGVPARAVASISLSDRIAKTGFATSRIYTPPSALSHHVRIVNDDPRYLRKVEYRRQLAIRSPHCHLREDRSFDTFKESIGRCMSIEPNKRNILIIGDSHAADFYSAIAGTHEDIHVLQATGQSCTPLLSRFPNPNHRCRRLIEYAVQFAEKVRLDAVFLAGLWYRDYEGLEPTIERLQSAGQYVVVVGVPLQFSADVFKIIARRPSDEALDAYATTFVNDNSVLERDLRDFANRSGALYLDRTARYCADRCPILNEDGDLLIRDYGHLTAMGAKYLGERLRIANVIGEIVATHPVPNR